jgi:D-3-phosphoglycerate dehydrogenase
VSLDQLLKKYVERDGYDLKLRIEKKILITEAMPLIMKEKEILEKIAIVKVADSIQEDRLLKEVFDVDIIMVVYAQITKKIIESAKNLRGIVRYGFGVDNIDIKVATSRGIPVAYVPNYYIGAVADHVFALLLSLTRKIMIADNVVRTGKYIGNWASPSIKIRGFELEGKILGIIGLGKVGRALVGRAKAFGMKVKAYDPYIDEEVAEELNVELLDLNKILTISDYVSIHVPLLSETLNMIGEKELKLMKKSAYLLNVARGPIVNEKALYKALKNEWIAGAGIDVYEVEPPDPENPLFKLENVVLTPHIAWYTEDALYRLEMSAVDEAVKILEGDMPKNLVNKKILSQQFSAL